MSTCMWPLLDLVGEEDESITEIIMDEISENLDWEVKRAINEVVRKTIGDGSSNV